MSSSAAPQSRLLRSSRMEARAFGAAGAFLGSSMNGHGRREFDCALVDVVMPGTNGLALQQELRQRGIRLPVVLMTAHDSDEVRGQALRQGAKGYLTKPLPERELFQAIAAATGPCAAPTAPGDCPTANPKPEASGI